MQVRDGPAAVRGDALRQDATGPRPGKAAEGEPRVRRPAGRPPSRTPRGRRIRGQTAHTARRSPARSACDRVCGDRQGARRRKDPHALRPDRGRRVTASNALEAIQQASLLGELYYHVTTTSFGPYVDQVGRYGGDASSGWVFKVDDVSPPVGADQVQLKDGDRVLWYYATSARPAARRRSRVKAATKKGCYTATAFDDNGKAVVADGPRLARRLEEDRRRRWPAPRSAPGRTPGC